MQLELNVLLQEHWKTTLEYWFSVAECVLRCIEGCSGELQQTYTSQSVRMYVEKMYKAFRGCRGGCAKCDIQPKVTAYEAVSVRAEDNMIEKEKKKIRVA